MGLNDLLTIYAKQSITVRENTGFDAYGSPIWASTTAASTYAALIVQKVQSIRDSKGVDKVSNTQIYLSGNTSINIEDKIVLPDATEPLIIAVQKYPDFDGTNVITEVFT